MNQTRKPRPRVLAVLLALIVVSGGIPFVVATHANDWLTPWRSIPDQPTGNDLLDSAIGAASQVLDTAAEDERIPRRDEPQLPATFFHDVFHPQGRIGGWGDWEPDARITVPNLGELGGWTVEERWHLHPSAAGHTVQVPWVTPAGNLALQTRAYDIDQGYRFGNEEAYPIPDETQAGLSFSILISPVISLQSLPVRLPDERADVPGSGAIDGAVGADGDGTVDLTQQLAARRAPRDGNLDNQDRIYLYLDHKYHLANADNTTRPERIGDRAGVYLLDEQGNVLHNNYLQPLRGESVMHPPENGFTGSFMGAQLEFREEAFDLSPWAGQNVRIAFEVGTEGLEGQTPAQHFGNETRFQVGADFYGWALSNVRVEGPAHVHNVRLDRVAYPNMSQPDGTLVAPTGTEPLKVLLLNRGRVTEDVRVRMMVDGIQRGDCVDEVLVPGLRPGAAVEVDFVQDRSVPSAQRVGCVDILDGQAFHARFEAIIQDRDLYEHDNRLTVRILGQGPDIRMGGRMVADPALERPNVPITLTLPIVNRGASPTDVDLTLKIDRRHPSSADFDQPDVHLGGGLVQFTTPLDQSLQFAGPATQTATWGFSIREAGLYRITVQATGADGSVFFTASGVIGVLMAAEFSYDTQFDGLAFDADTVIAGEWAGASLRDPAPPCTATAGRGNCLALEDSVVWELDSKQRLAISAHTGDRGLVSYGPAAPLFARGQSTLRAEFDVAAAGQSASVITAVEVEVLHHATDLRCQMNPVTPWACDIPFRGSSAVAPTAPMNRLSLRLTQDAVLPTNAPNTNGILNAIEIQHIGGSHYRNAFYSSQWIQETHTVTLAGLLGQGSMTVAELTSYGLEFVLHGGCVTRSSNVMGCPMWRVAEASVRGLPEAGGPPISLFHWSGIRDEAPRGSWYSYFVEESPDILGVRQNQPWTQRYPNCLDNERNQIAFEQNRLYCPIWAQQPVSSFVNEENTAWNQDSGGFWTHANRQGGKYYYAETPGGMLDALTSPVFLVPDGQSPIASFEHRFQLHPYTQDVDGFGTPPNVNLWARSPSSGDSGMMMVRFFDANGHGPVTPFLPVYLDGGRFMRHDCQHYYGVRPALGFTHPLVQHPDRANGCPDALMGRSPVRETFDLSALPILDYRGPSATLLDVPVTGGHNGDNSGYGLRPDATERMIPEPGDVRNAFQRIDTRICTADGFPTARDAPVPVGAKPCAVQFAFRLEIPVANPITDDVWDVASQKANARFNQIENGPGDAEGWFIDSFRIVKDDLIDFDLELLDARIDTSYLWEDIGLGPGTDAVANLTVRNNGFFTVDQALYHLTIQDVASPDKQWRFEQGSDAEFVLGQGDEMTVNIPFILPPEDGNYFISFGVDLLGDLIAAEGIVLVDMDRSNDCRFLVLTDNSQRSQPLGRGVNGCSPSPLGVPIVRNPDLGLTLAISPEAGRTGEQFPREVTIQIQNAGNSVVKNARLNLVVARAAEDAVPEVFRWTITESPLPGHSRSWTGLPLVDATGEPALPLARIVLDQDGTYFVTAFMSPSPEDRADGHVWEALRQVRLDAFDTIYADTFGSQRIEPDHPSMVSGDEMLPRHEAWQNIRVPVPDASGTLRSANVWRLGDIESGQYPAGADATLELPPIDLSAARSATLAISHRYEFEPGYDGAAVEASVDGGNEWWPLEPRAGYPATVAAQNPLNAANDPTLQVGAFSGDSLSRNPLTDGWVIDEFDLATLPDFTTPVLVERFNQIGFEGGPHVGSPNVQRPNNGGISYHPDWSLPRTECSGKLATCWSRDNANWQNPVPLQPGGNFLWSGSVGGLARPEFVGTGVWANEWKQPGTQLNLDLEVPILDSGQTARLRYSYWKDVGGRLTVEADGVPPAGLIHHRGSTSGGWVEGSVTVPRDEFLDGVLQVRVLFEAELCAGPGGQGDPFGTNRCDVVSNRANRGAALDQVILEVLEHQAGQSVVVQALDVLRNGEAGPNVVMATSLFARGPGGDSLGLHRDIPIDGNNGFCTRTRIAGNPPAERQNNFTMLCQRVDGQWRLIDSWGWRPTGRVPASPEAWGIDEVRNRQGEMGLVWRFGTEFDSIDNSGRTSYPANANERLVTPRMDLRGVAGESVSLTSWWKYDMASPNHARRVLIQVVELTPDGGERLSEWQPLMTAPNPRSLPTGPGCSDDLPAWCPVLIDISAYKGQVVRFAFEVQTTRLVPLPAPLVDGGPALGWTWLIDEVGVQADSLVGQPVLLRLRAATDGSINEGYWMVENVQVVGLTYASNVAILPDEPVRDRDLGANEVIQLSGTIRNLGPDPQRHIYLALTARATGDEEVDLPEVRFLLDGDGKPGETVAGRVGPIFLGAAGATSNGVLLDRIPYHVNVTLPDVNPNTMYRFQLEIQDEGGDLLTDGNLGDHLREFQVRIHDSRTYQGLSFKVDRPTLESLGETARFTLDLRNTGAIRMDGAIEVWATQLSPTVGEPAPLASVAMGEVVPDARRAVAWDWDTTGWAPGFYRITATVTPSTGHGPQTFFTHVLVGSLPIYYVEDFATDPFARPEGQQWQRFCAPPARPCWGTSTVFQATGGQSLFMGTHQPPAPTVDNPGSQARTPSIDLSFLARDAANAEAPIVQGESPFKPYLSLSYQPMLAGTNNVVVQGWPGTGAYRNMLTGDPLRGRENDMQVTSFPLFHASNSVLGTGVRLLGPNSIGFQFNTGTWSPGDGFGLAIDHITISSYDVEVAPPRHDIDLRLGSDKVFYFKVENTGAARDTYRVAIDPLRTADIFQTPLVTLDVLTPELALDPGESGLAAVHVAIPFQRLPDLFTGTTIAINVASSVDPNRIGTGTIGVERFIVDDLADLVTDLRRPRGESGPVVEGEQATFIVSVTNEGTRISRETDLVLFACPLKHKGQPVSIKECGALGLAKQLGAVRLPTLVPSRDALDGRTDHVSTTTFSWVPPLGSRGEYQIVAVADPRQIVTQFDRSSSTAKLDLAVAPIERPDLVVTELRVTNARGDVVTRAFAGETLQIQGTVRNEGNAPAPNVNIRIVNQFTLRDERVGALDPGAQRTLHAQWVAQPGNWVILVEGSTSIVEIHSDNNARRWSLAVRSGALQASWDPQIVHLDPGGSADAALRIDNRRDAAADLVVRAETGDVSLHGMPTRIELARGASTEVPLLATVSPFADAGRHLVKVDLTQRDTGAVLATATLEVHVGADRMVRVAADPLFAPPGTVRWPLTFSNGGSAPEAFTVELELPDDWAATVLQPTIRLAPGAKQVVHAFVEIPAGTPAGQYGLVVKGGGVVRQSLSMEVVAQPVWRTDVKTTHDLGDLVEVHVLVANIGNVRAAPPFSMGGSTAHGIQPVPSPHEPGESRSYSLRLAPASALVLPGQDAEVPVDLRPQRPNVEATRFEARSPGPVRSGDGVTMRLQVHATGSEAQSAVPVHLLVDGVRITGARVDLEPGQTKEVLLTWQVGQPGVRVVTAVLGSGDEAVVRATLVNVEEGRSLGIPGPGVVFLLMVLAVAVVARRRQRR